MPIATGNPIGLLLTLTYTVEGTAGNPMYYYVQSEEENMIYLDVDTALSEVPVNTMPLIDDTDFKSREESVAYNADGLDLVWNFVTTAGAMAQTAVTPTDTGGAYDWVNQGNGMYSIEIPASGGASINNDTEGFGWFTGFATGILPWRGPVIGFRASGLNDKLIDSAYSATRGLAGTALPDAAADAAGGLPISDDGGLDLDAQIGTDIDAIKAKTDNLPADPADDSDLDTAIAAVKTVVDAVKLKTDNLPADPADDSDIDTQLATIAGYVDELETRLTAARAGYLDKLNVSGTLAHSDAAASYKADVSALATAAALANLDSDVADVFDDVGDVKTVLDLTKADTAAIKAKTDNLPADPADDSDLDTAIAAVKSVVDAVKAKTDNLPADPADDSDIDTSLALIKAKTDLIPAGGIAQEATLTAMKGAGWTDETLVSLQEAIAEIDAGSGSSAEEIWEYASRTLTMTPTEISDVAVDGTISQTRGNDWTITFTGLSLTGTDMQFGIKNALSQADANATLLMDETGLLYLNGAAADAGDLEKATMTYDSGTLTITVTAEITAQLDAGVYHYGLQDIDGDGVVSERYMGTFTILADVVRGVS